MAYTKPIIVAQNNVSGSYAAGCPTNTGSKVYPDHCRKCETTI